MVLVARSRRQMSSSSGRHVGCLFWRKLFVHFTVVLLGEDTRAVTVFLALCLSVWKQGSTCLHRLIERVVERRFLNEVTHLPHLWTSVQVRAGGIGDLVLDAGADCGVAPS